MLSRCHVCSVVWRHYVVRRRHGRDRWRELGLLNVFVLASLEFDEDNNQSGNDNYGDNRNDYEFDSCADDAHDVKTADNSRRSGLGGWQETCKITVYYSQYFDDV